MDIFKSKPPDPVLDAVQKLRREIRESMEGLRQQQSAQHDRIISVTEQTRDGVNWLKQWADKLRGK